ncbi:hypothetical protein OEZ86_006047 [Tetradesmus obliquus]|nr:hypothetical protein OEZ86_006047 [Tetradesmus obliquus]
MEGAGFVRGGERSGNDAEAAAAASQPAAAGSGVVILAPKQVHSRAPAEALHSNILGIRRVLKQRAAAASGRAASPDSPPAGRRPEKMKARMRLVMAKAEQQKAAADAAADTDAAAAAAAARGEAGWTRFVFDKHSALDEEKLARQQLMDAEVAAGIAGSSAAVGADVEEAGAAFVMGTGRAAAQRAAKHRTAEQQHEDAIFGRPYLGSEGSMFGGSGEVQAGGEAAASLPAAAAVVADGDSQLAASLGVSGGVLSGQQLSWRERLALKKKQQQ